jgi:sugar transferase (PEP-CTERM/EpsH1 system associated)
MKFYLKDDIKVIDMNFPEGKSLMLFSKMYKFLKSEKPDIVHTHNFYSGIYSIISAKLAKIPVILHGVHGELQIDNTSKILTTKVLSLFVDKFLTVSETLKDKISRVTGIYKDKIQAILNGINLDKFNKGVNIDLKKEEFGINDDIKIIGSVGRLVSVKNYALLIKAFALLLNSYPNTELLLVGDGPLRNELEELSKRLKISEKVIFTGSRNDVAELLNIMDIFVLTSKSEGMSNTILEAMASKLPVVASDVGNNSELIKTGKNGILVTELDERKFSEAISTILSDSVKAKIMGEYGYEQIRNNFSLEKMVNKYEDIYGYCLLKKGIS